MAIALQNIVSFGTEGWQAEVQVFPKAMAVGEPPIRTAAKPEHLKYCTIMCDNLKHNIIHSI